MTEGETEEESGEVLSNDRNRLQLPESSKGTYARFAMAALGSIPWVGGVIAGGAALNAEREQGRVNENIDVWLKEHEDKIGHLFETLSAIASRVENLGDFAKERVQDEQYLQLVRKGFRTWDRAETEDKRTLVQHLLTNAAGSSVADDDIVRLFLDWIDRYHEAHFGIIRSIYKTPGITLLGIWREMGNPSEIPRENSSSADLYRMLIHDLSTGRVIRQERRVNSRGQFLKKPRGGRRAPSSDVMKSSFDDIDRYELTELGQEFVHYVLQDAVSRIESE